VFLQFGKFTRMGLNKDETTILMAAGHTIASGLEGAAFDNTPHKFDMNWFGVSTFGEVLRSNFCWAFCT